MSDADKYPGHGRVTADRALEAAKDEVARRNARVQAAARKVRDKQEEKETAQRRKRDLL